MFEDSSELLISALRMAVPALGLEDLRAIKAKELQPGNLDEEFGSAEIEELMGMIN